VGWSSAGVHGPAADSWVGPHTTAASESVFAWRAKVDPGGPGARRQITSRTNHVPCQPPRSGDRRCRGHRGKSDGYLNVHKSCWGIGRLGDLFSSWRRETKADWGRHPELLSDLPEVEPIIDEPEGDGLRLYRPGDD
jgi:hypothetical protein